jgi:hypothetical protein
VVGIPANVVTNMTPPPPPPSGCHVNKAQRPAARRHSGVMIIVAQVEINGIDHHK